MNPHLQKQQEAFKSTLLRQSQLPPAAVPPRPSQINTNSAGLTTIGGRPINSYVHSIISYLKVPSPLGFPFLSASYRALRSQYHLKSFTGTLGSICQLARPFWTRSASMSESLLMEQTCAISRFSPFEVRRILFVFCPLDLTWLAWIYQSCVKPTPKSKRHALYSSSTTQRAQPNVIILRN